MTQTFEELLAERDADGDGFVQRGEWDDEMIQQLWFLMDVDLWAAIAVVALGFLEIFNRVRVLRTLGSVFTVGLIHMELASVRRSLANLSVFPTVAARVATRGLVLAGAYFDIADGQLYLCDAETGAFRPVD